MKRIWTILSVLALANVLAVGVLVGWLVSSDRLNKDRVEQVRAILARTVAQEQADAKAKADEAAQEQQAADEAARMAVPPIPSAEIVAATQLVRDADLQVDLRRQRELEDMRSSLLRLQAGLEAREAELARRVEEFEESKELYASIEGAEQFKTALTTLEGQRPRDAKAVLQSLLQIGQQEQVTAYLANMDESKRSKIVAEFVKDNAAVAADLLERLRTRGIGPSREVAAGASANAQPDQGPR